MKSYIKNIKDLLFIIGIKKAYLFFLIFLFFIAGVVDLLSLGLIAPYVTVIFNIENSFNYEFLKFTGLENLNSKNIVILLSILLILLFFLKSFFSVFIRWLIAKFAFKQHALLQVNLLSAYQNMKYEDYILRNSAEYIRNVRELSSQCVNSIESFLRAASELIILTAVVIYLGFFNLKILGFLLLIIGPIYLIYEYILKPINIKLGVKKVHATKYIYKGIDSAIKGFKDIRILGKEKFFRNIIKKAADEILDSDLKSALIKDSPRYVFEFAIVCSAILLVLITIMFNENISFFLPTVAVFMVASLRILPGISLILNCLTHISYGQYAVTTVYDDLKKSSYSRRDSYTNINYDNKNFKSIDLKDVKFKYKNSENYVFENINFSLKENECVGIIGESGVGKTTLIDILLGLLIPQQGKIFVNDKLVSDISLNFSGNIAYLPQEPIILDENLITNITLETENKKIDSEKLEKSITQANLKKVLDILPNGLNTIIGEGGVRLSIGQGKRVALARTFYHGKKIIVMDEATSSLDPKTENYIVEQIKEIKGKRTILIITHKINTLQHCDKIYKIENKSINQFR